jgi:hypothetical protein
MQVRQNVELIQDAHIGGHSKRYLFIYLCIYSVLEIASVNSVFSVKNVR